VTFRVHLQLAASVTLGHFGVGLYDDADQVVAGWAFEPVSVPTGSRSLEVTVPILPLRPGSYRLKFTLFDRGSNLTGGRLVESWVGVPQLSLNVPPLSHPQDEWAGMLNVPATLAGHEGAGADAWSSSAPGAAAAGTPVGRAGP
jgi:hypothetical protein